MKTTNKIKAYRYYMTKGTPAMGGFPAVPGRVVRVTGWEDVNGEKWCRVRFTDTGIIKASRRCYGLLVHPSELQEIE